MTQLSREALIELLFLALYLDDHLSLAEDEVLGVALESIGWEGDHAREVFLLAAFSRAREASGCAIRTEAFLNERASTLKQEGEKATALTWLSRILASDGLTAGEKRFLGKLETALFA